jgi:hypothetical protein
MVSRDLKDINYIIKARFITKGDPELLLELEKVLEKRRKILDSPKLVYLDNNSNTKKSISPIKKTRKIATTITIISLIKNRKI